jgi:hypothetical protein
LALHFGRFKYEVEDTEGEAPKVRITQISGYSTRELISHGDMAIPIEWLDPLVSYVGTMKKELMEIERLEAEIADLSHRLGFNPYGVD